MQSYELLRGEQMRCATCSEYFHTGGCQHGTLTPDFETLAFCGTACYIEFLSTKPNRRKNNTMNRSTANGRINCGRWVNL